MRRSKRLAAAVCAMTLVTGVWAADEPAGGVRLKIRPMQSQGGMGMMAMPVQQGQGAMAQPGQVMMPMMQQCMQWHQQVMARLEHLDGKIDHILKERERESHQQLKAIEEKLKHMSEEIDHILAEREKESHERLSAIERKIDHILREEEQETHRR